MFYKKNKLLILFIFIAGYTFPQSAAGDIAFTSYNGDGDDDFSFVLLVDVSNSTSIYFTDNEWTGAAFNNTNEGTITWTANSDLGAGTVIVVTDAGSSSGRSVNIGTISGSGSFNLGASNESLFALSAAPATSYGSAPTFYACISNDEDANGNVLTNTGLTSGTHTIDFNNDQDGYEFTGTRTGEASFSDYLAIINNTSNWQQESSNGENILPISTLPFTIESVTISGNAGFRMLSAPVSNGTYTDLLSELWTQGMTGSDAAEASGDNVWTWTVGSGGAGSWSVVSNLGNTMTAGEGILVYAFADNNNDGTDDLPVTLSVSGSESSGDVRYPPIGSIEDTRFGFAGNPYYQTIDWDDVARTNVSATVYIHDDAKSGGAGYISWNGSSGDVTNGFIAPFQGFVVTASGGAGYITIQTADKSSTAGTFFRTLDGASDGSSYLEFTTAEGRYSKSWFSFRQDGEVGPDDRDANRLMPLMASSRLVSLTHNGENSLDINNVPFDHEGVISIPLDVMSLSLEEENYVTGTSEVSMSWNLDNLPDHIDLTLVDNLTGEMVYLNNDMSHTFTTEPKGSFSATYEEAVGIYPLLGDARFSVQVSYGVLDNAPVKVIPKDYALSPVYPNPFNPSATVRFDVPEVSRVELQVYDVTGKLVETLLDNKMTTGQHQYTWQPQELATGTYFLRLITANQTFTQKVTYVK